MGTHQKLYQLTDDFRNLQELVESGEMTETDIKDTLEAIEVSIEEKVDGICAVIANMNESVPAIDDQIKRLQARKKSIVNEEKKLREYLLTNLQKVGKKSVKTSIWTTSVRKGSAKVVVDNVEELPDECVEVVTDVKPLITVISRLIESGENVKGAHVEVGSPTLMIR